jgi:CubicO group peptidase (beta-lactamase class C family)
MTLREKLLAAAFLLIAVAAQAQNGNVDFTALDKVAGEEMKARHTPGATVAVVIGDRVVYAKGYGVASVETATPVTTETLFRMGSTTKMFTAAALVTLADRGKIKLDAPVGEFVKGLHPSVARVTAHQLLSQSAGLRDFASPVTSHDDAALGENVRSWKEDVFFTEPGKIYSYSSAGYWLAGFVAEELHGKPYADAMEELVFRPLGMARTTLRPLAAATYPLAMGHNVVENKPAVIRPVYNNVAMWPGGSIFSSVSELARFAVALMHGGKIEGKQALAPLVAEKLPARQFRLPGAEEVHYGYGLLGFEQRGVRVVSHGGASRGYGSSIDLAPERKFAVIVLTNRSGETLPATRAKAMELALALKPQPPDAPPQPLPVGANEMADYVGTYVHAPQRWEVSARDGKLFIKDEGGEFALTKVGERTFAYGNAGENQIIFVSGADGKTEHLFMGLYAAKKAARAEGK